MITFDIETRPHWDKEFVDSFKKPFDPQDVALGNIKDPVKIEAKIEKARQEHEDKFYKDALLKAELSMVFSLQILKPSELDITTALQPNHTAKIEIDDTMFDLLIWINNEEHDERESQMVNWFFGLYQQVNDLHFGKGQTDIKMIGHNIYGFDLPYLRRKAWQYRIKTPADFITGRSYNQIFEDTSSIWGEGIFNRNDSKIGSYISLNNLSKFLKTGYKDTEITEFMYSYYQIDRNRALQYMAKDVILTYKNYKIMKGM